MYASLPIKQEQRTAHTGQMQRFTNLPNTNIEPIMNMNIQHLTHDSSRGIRRPNTATRVRGFFERRRSSIKDPLMGARPVASSSSSGQGSSRNSCTTTGSSPTSSDPYICSFLLPQHVEAREASRQLQRPENLPVQSTKRVGCEVSKVLPSNPKQRTQQANCVPSVPHTASPYAALPTIRNPSLKRRPAFQSKLKQKFKEDLAELKANAHIAFESPSKPLDKRTHKISPKASAEHANHARLALQQDHAAVKRAIREGKLERVVPHHMQQAHDDAIGVCSQTHYKHSHGLIPPNTSSTPRSSTTGGSGSHRSTKSSSSGISARPGQNTGASADILDSSSRKLATGLRKSAARGLETLHSDYDSDTDSDESFFCQANEDKREARLGGRGTNPWEGKRSMCRLCHKHVVDDIGGLCRTCKDEFRRPRSFSEDDELRPIPPLKDFRKPRANVPQLKAAKGATKAHLVTEDLNGGRFIPAQEVAFEATTPPSLHSSEDSNNDPHISVYQRWQSPAIRNDYLHAENLFDRWSLSYERDDYASPRIPSTEYSNSSIGPMSSSSFEHGGKSFGIDEGDVPLLAEESVLEKQHFLTKRDSTFYGFWDDVFREHGVYISTN